MCHEFLYDILISKNLGWLLIAFKIFDFFLTFKEFLMAHSLWIFYHIYITYISHILSFIWCLLQILRSWSYTIKEWYTKILMSCKTKKKERHYRAVFKKRMMCCVHEWYWAWRGTKVTATFPLLLGTMTGIDPDPRLAVRRVIGNFYITIWQMSQSIHGMNAS